MGTDNKILGERVAQIKLVGFCHKKFINGVVGS